MIFLLPENNAKTIKHGFYLPVKCFSAITEENIEAHKKAPVKLIFTGAFLILLIFKQDQQIIDFDDTVSQSTAGSEMISEIISFLPGLLVKPHDAQEDGQEK
jgi:hypothetical protein